MQVHHFVAIQMIRVPLFQQRSMRIYGREEDVRGLIQNVKVKGKWSERHSQIIRQMPCHCFLSTSVSFHVLLVSSSECGKHQKKQNVSQDLLSGKVRTTANTAFLEARNLFWLFVCLF